MIPDKQEAKAATTSLGEARTPMASVLHSTSSSTFPTSGSGVPILVKLPHDQMQEQIHIHLDLPSPAEELQKLRVVELCLQELIQRHLRAGAGHGDGSVAALEGEDAHFVAGDGEIDVRPLAFRVPAPLHQNTSVGEFLGGVLERAEFGDAAGALQFALVVPLLGEGHEEAFLALFVLQGDHGLFDVVVVRLELLLEVAGLIVESSEGEADALEFALALDAAAVLGADIDGNFVENVLVVVVTSEMAGLLETKDIFQGGAFELGV